MEILDVDRWRWSEEHFSRENSMNKDMRNGELEPESIYGRMNEHSLELSSGKESKLKR